MLEFQKQTRKVHDGGREFQTTFFKLVKSFKVKGSSGASGDHPYHQPKQFKGTIKRYLTDL